MKILLFGGTSEGAELARLLPQRGYDVTVSVATDYGALMVEGTDAKVLTGRLSAEEMAELMRNGRFDRVIDATHPYAAEVSVNIRKACEEAGLPYERLLRPEGQKSENAVTVSTPEEAVKILAECPGNILLTTGSKDLELFTQISDYRDRIWVRILASQASLHQALSLGYPSNHIIAMHGPFSKELNLALLHQFQIKTLVTKRSGKAGGFPEKAEAAQEAGAMLLVIERPVKENGYTLSELLEKYQ